MTLKLRSLQKLLPGLVATAVFGAGLLIGSGALAHGEKDWPVPEEAKKLKNPVPPSEAALQAAQAIYVEKCLQCHGDTGNGQGPQAMMYDVKPANFTDAHMMREMTDGEIFWKMSEGRAPMPGFKKQLTEEQRWQLVHYIRTFAPKPPPKAAEASHAQHHASNAAESGGPAPSGRGGAAGASQGHFGSSVEILTPTEGVDFKNYIAHMLATVRRNWYAVMPMPARQGEKGIVVLEFSVLKDGRLPPGDPQLLRSSSHEPLDRAAISAIRASSPFELLPREFSGPLAKFRLTFRYNISVGQQ